MTFEKGQPSANPAGRKRNRYPERIYWEEVKQKLGLSTLDLARELGVCVRTVECWERGEKNYRGAAKRPPPPVMILVKKLLLIHELIGDMNATVPPYREDADPFEGAVVTIDTGGKDE